MHSSFDLRECSAKRTPESSQGFGVLSRVPWGLSATGLKIWQAKQTSFAVSLAGKFGHVYMLIYSYLFLPFI